LLKTVQFGQGRRKIVKKRDEESDKMQLSIAQNKVLQGKIAALERDLAKERAKHTEGEDATKKLIQLKRKWSDLTALLD
jgi:type II secretory pathway component PulJ